MARPWSASLVAIERTIFASVRLSGGGGRPEFAQAGGKEPAKIAAALKRAEELIREAK